MITLAILRPGRAPSGRRYFRGSDKRGTTYWMMEQPGSEGHRWILKVDAGGSMAAEDLMEIDGPKAMKTLPAR